MRWEEIISEGPVNQEGGMWVCYHRTKNTDMSSYEQTGFVSNSFDNAMYGPGMYAFTDWESAQNPKLKKFGSTMLKLKVSFNGYLILNPTIAERVYGEDAPVEKQLVKFGLDPRLASRIQNAKGDKITSGPAKAAFDYFYGKADISGIVYSCPHDGNAVVAWKVKTMTPFAYALDVDSSVAEDQVEWQKFGSVPAGKGVSSKAYSTGRGARNTSKPLSNRAKKELNDKRLGLLISNGEMPTEKQLMLYHKDSNIIDLLVKSKNWTPSPELIDWLWTNSKGGEANLGKRGWWPTRTALISFIKSGGESSGVEFVLDALLTKKNNLLDTEIAQLCLDHCPKTHRPAIAKKLADKGFDVKQPEVVKTKQDLDFESGFGDIFSKYKASNG